jgi:DNA polymerase III alpha subunit
MSLLRTSYSFGFALGRLETAIARLKELHWPAAPICDRASTFGFARWTKACAKAELRPVYGVELGVTADSTAARPSLDYWSFYALDSLAPLNQLVYAATQARREPCLTYEQALSASGVLKVTGERCMLPMLKPQDDLWIGLMPSTPRGFYNAAHAAGHKFCASSDNAFIEAGDEELYRLGLRRAATQTYPRWLLTDAEWTKAVSWFVPGQEASRALVERDIILNACKAELPLADIFHPPRPAPLRTLCEQGAAHIGINLNDPTYAARLERELKLIEAKGYEDYFYILADIVGWARQHLLVGPARGSSCGSLVCYLLAITTIDPLRYNLLFERFIDINRFDMPDVDWDVDAQQRDRVFDYVASKFGREHVARLGSVGTFKPRSALRAAAMALRIPDFKIEKALRSQVEHSSGDSRAMLQLEDTLNKTAEGQAFLMEFPEAKHAARLEGLPVNASQHAAGIVLTSKPIINYAAINARTGSAMVDKKDAETLNLLKIDTLGLTQLSIFARTMELARLPVVSSWLDQIPLDDQEAINVFNSRNFSGIFQFNGAAVQNVVAQVTVRDLHDIIAITALARPGPLATGAANSWIKRRVGREQMEYIHPLYDAITESTAGVVIYQEQVMRIAREIGQLSWEDTSELRRAMSKSLGDEFFGQYKSRFVEGAVAQGISPELANRLWKMISTYGSWSFNQSHATAYGIISYWCAWFKAHYPLEFAAATLDSESLAIRQITILRELEKEGVGYVPVDIDKSGTRWTVETIAGRRTLVGPLTGVKGIGPAFVAEILNARKKKLPIRPLLERKLKQPKTDIDDLYPISAALRTMYPDLSAANITTKPTPISAIKLNDPKFGVVIIGVATRISPRDENEQINIQRRGYKLDPKIAGGTTSLNMFIKDDTDEVFCKIEREDYLSMGQPIVDRGVRSQAIYALKGYVPKTFRMLKVERVRYLGSMKDKSTVLLPSVTQLGGQAQTDILR